MTHEISLPRMSHLSMFEGTIGIEDVGEGENVAAFDGNVDSTPF